MKILVLLAVVLLLMGCTREAKEEEEYLAKVNNETLSYEDFRASFDDATWENMNWDAKEEHIQKWVNLTALAQKCDNEKLSEQLVIRGRIESAVKKIKANTVIASQMNVIKITEEELFSYYQLHKREYLKKVKEYKYQRIVISSDSIFQSAVAELKEGKKFKDVAEKYSETSEGSGGGYMGFASKGDVNESIWNTLEDLEQYRWKSVNIENKFYLLRWYDKQEATIEKNYAELQDSLRERLLQEKKDKKYEELMKEIRMNFDIEINYLGNGDSEL